MTNTNRNEMIECLVNNYKSELMYSSNYKIAKEVFDNMKCENCPLKSTSCNYMACFEKAYDFIEESEVEDGQNHKER